MKSTLKMFAIAAFCASIAVPASFAQDHHDDRPADHHDNYVRHDEWKKGYKMQPNDWSRAQPVDYHNYHLSAPPRGYEWREVDGNYVLAAAATGIIASAIVASTIH
jgi:Ni/Co efflux regulator RcnB